jgi:hypothetical protein
MGAVARRFQDNTRMIPLKTTATTANAATAKTVQLGTPCGWEPVDEGSEDSVDDM